jgi:hypothetical protein
MCGVHVHAAGTAKRQLLWPPAAAQGALYEDYFATLAHNPAER